MGGVDLISIELDTSLLEVGECFASGLGILDLGDINKALTTKWIYSYANNREALRRKVVCTCNKVDPNSLISSLGNNGNKSVFWFLLMRL